MKSKIVGSSPKGDGMSAAVEAKTCLSGMVDPRQPLKASLPAVAERLGMSARRVRAIWHGEARRIEADEIARLRAATLKQEVGNARHQLARLEAMAARLEATDADFHASDIAQARALAGRLRAFVGRGA